MGAQTEIIKKYGLPGQQYQSKYCIVWEVKRDFPWFPCDRIFINKDFKDKLFKAFKELEQAGVAGEIKTYDGCYEDRKVRGSDSISLHSWAMAIDFNAKFEKLGQNITHFSKEFVNIMIKNGLFWGGNYAGRKDPMHFSLYNG